MTGALYKPDDRTISQYTDEVKKWHSEWTERAPEHWMGAYTAAGHGTCSLSLTNLTDHNFISVEVRLEVPDAQVITDLDDIETELPNMPLPYGQGRWSPGFDMDLSTPRLARLGYRPTVWADDSLGRQRRGQSLCDMGRG